MSLHSASVPCDYTASKIHRLHEDRNSSGYLGSNKLLGDWTWFPDDHHFQYQSSTTLLGTLTVVGTILADGLLVDAQGDFVQSTGRLLCESYARFSIERPSWDPYDVDFDQAVANIQAMGAIHKFKTSPILSSIGNNSYALNFEHRMFTSWSMSSFGNGPSYDIGDEYSALLGGLEGYDHCPLTVISESGMSLDPMYRTVCMMHSTAKISFEMFYDSVGGLKAKISLVELQ